MRNSNISNLAEVFLLPINLGRIRYRLLQTKLYGNILISIRHKNRFNNLKYF